MLQQSRDNQEMDGFAFTRAEEQRSQLIDHLGACERILRTPLAKVLSIKIRRFLFLYLIALPLAIVDKSGYLTPFLTMLVAYPLLSLDQIGIELENPFCQSRLSHLPLETIGETIERNVMSLENAPSRVTRREEREAVGVKVPA
jgi:ion channel-forming bestrophin family protein